MHELPAELANIAAPPYALQVEPWVDETGDGTTWGRFIRGTRRATAGAEVTRCGWQSAYGTVERHASLCANDVHIDAAELRRLAGELLDAADELDQLDDGPPRPCGVPRWALIEPPPAE
jgi:hypothetical protein